MKGLLTSLFIVSLCTSLLQAQPFKVIVHVRAHDGSPLPANSAGMTQYGINELETVPGSKVGDRYEFIVKTPGTYWVRATGSNHRAFRGPVLVGERPVIDFEVRLGTLSAEFMNPDSVFVMGNFNDYSLDSGLIKMTQQKNRSYAAEVEISEDSLIYKPVLFLNGEGIPVDAPGASHYRYDTNRFTFWQGGNYYAVKHIPMKTMKLSFQPQTLLATDLPASLRFKESGTRTARLATAYNEADFRIMKFRLAYYNFIEKRQLGNYEDFLRAYPKDEDLRYLTALAGSTSDQLRKDVYNLACFHFTRDSSRVSKALTTLPPHAVVWQIGHFWTQHFLNAIPDQKQAALLSERIARHQGNDGIRADYLVFALGIYFNLNDPDFVRLYDYVMTEFSNYPAFLEWIKSRHPLRRTIAVGKPIPDFEFVSMDDNASTISNTSLKGKTYLIDLWATWCAPCVAEMNTLHSVYDKFQQNGFTIVSLSFDEKTETVTRFRQKKWEMPWHNALAGTDRDAAAKVEKLFESQGLPRAILVDKRGIVVGVDEQLKGEKLDKILTAMYEGQ